MILALLLLPLAVSLAHPAITVSLTVTDAEFGGTDLSVPNPSGPIGTEAWGHGYYSDSADRVGIMAVFYSPDGVSGWTFQQLLFFGTISSGSTTNEKFILTDLGYYLFEWIVQGDMEAKLVATEVGPVLPGPGTLVGLLTSMAALGLFVSRKRLFK